MKVLILAAGYGTRLYPLTLDKPKPLLPIHEKTIVDYLLDRLGEIQNLKEVLLVTNHKFSDIFLAWAKSKKDFPVPIHIVDDGTLSPDDRLGSVGDIDFVIKKHKIQDDLLVLGGDNLFDYSLKDFMAFSSKKRPAATIGLYDIGSKNDATQFGVVSLDEKRKVILFEEKPAKPQSSLIAMCLYYFPKESLGLVQAYLDETHKADKAGDYIHWLSENHSVYGFKFTGKWYDIGSLEAYQEAQEQFKSLKNGR